MYMYSEYAPKRCGASAEVRNPNTVRFGHNWGRCGT